jgi:hypothetical protein
VNARNPEFLRHALRGRLRAIGDAHDLDAVNLFQFRNMMQARVAAGTHDADADRLGHEFFLSGEIEDCAGSYRRTARAGGFGLGSIQQRQRHRHYNRSDSILACT